MSRVVLSAAASWSIVALYLILVLAATTYISIAFVKNDLGFQHFGANVAVVLLAFPLGWLLNGWVRCSVLR